MDNYGIILHVHVHVLHVNVHFNFLFRIRELFDIIVDFPDSESALVDLRECLRHVDLREELMESLTKVLDLNLNMQSIHF